MRKQLKPTEHEYIIVRLRSSEQHRGEGDSCDGLHHRSHGSFLIIVVILEQNSAVFSLLLASLDIILIIVSFSSCLSTISVIRSMVRSRLGGIGGSFLHSSM